MGRSPDPVMCPDACSVSPISTALSSDTLWVSRQSKAESVASKQKFYLKDDTSEG